MNPFRVIRMISICIVLFLVGAPILGYGYVMGSSAYRIDSDSINVGGLSFSTSTNYSLGSTVGEIATGYSSSSIYSMSAGFWTPDDIYISISSPSDANVGAISGLLGGVGNASSTWIVTTNNPDGYQLNAVASTEPAMRSPISSIADYDPVTSDPDYTFTVASSDARFGFSVEGAHTTQRFKDDGNDCGVGSSNGTDTCWDGFSTTTKAIATSGSGNHPSGTATILKYRVEIGNAFIQEASSLYEASITVTATAL